MLEISKSIILHIVYIIAAPLFLVCQ